MGIPGIIKGWLERKNYPGVILTGLPQWVSSISFDLPSLLHICAQINYAYDDYRNEKRLEEISKMSDQQLKTEYFNLIGSTIMSVIVKCMGDQTRPIDYLVLAIDGVVPLAKMQQSRVRRYGGAYSDSKKDPDERSRFNSHWLTPGTKLMFELDLFLLEWIKKNASRLPSKVIYSGHMVPSEGEHKIFDLMRTRPDIYDHTKVHMVYGLDADLIMLSAESPVPFIQLIREDYNKIIDIFNLRKVLRYELSPSSDQISPTVVDDFVLIMFLMGNDFLPKGPALEHMREGIDRLFDVYKSLSLPIVDPVNKDIIYDHLIKFLESAAAAEPDLMNDIAKQETKYPSRMIEYAITKIQKVGDNGEQTFERVFDFSKFRNSWYQNALGIRCSEEFEDLVTESDVDVSDIKSTVKGVEYMCRSYLKGLFWVLKYYTKGPSAVNNFYMYPFTHAPLICDLVAVAKKYKPDIEKLLWSPDDPQMTVFHQQLIVFPISSLSIAAPEIRSLFKRKSSIRDLMPTKFIVEKDGKNSDLKFIKIVPPSDPYRVHNSLIDIVPKMTERRYKVIFGRHKSLLIDLSPLQMDGPTQGTLRKQLESIIYPTRGKGRGSGSRSIRGRDRGRGRTESRVIESSERGSRGRISRGRGVGTRGRIREPPVKGSRSEGYTPKSITSSVPPTEKQPSTRGRGRGTRSEGYAPKSISGSEGSKWGTKMLM